MNQRLGLIAGFGSLPFVLAKEGKEIDLYVVGFKGITSKKLGKFVKEIKFFDVGSLEKIVGYFRDNNVSKILLLGYVPHQILVGKYNLDSSAISLFSRIKYNTAMEIFCSLEKELSNYDIKIESLDKYLPDIFAEEGLLSGEEITKEEMENIKFGYEIAKEIARLDIGLTVVVKNKVVVAVEGLEGTDNCILRGEKLAGEGCIVVKVARPNQDMRFDLPVIGPKTVKVLRKSKVKVLAIEKEKTLIIDKQKVIKDLNKSGIKLYAI